MTTPTSRVQILERPVALPGKCIICSSASNNEGRKFIDFGYSIDWWGAVYFCTVCFKEVAEDLGWIEDTRYKQILEENRELSDSIIKLDKRIENLNAVIRDSSDSANASYSSGSISYSKDVSPAFEGNNIDADKSDTYLDESDVVEESRGVLSSTKSNRSTDDSLSF